MTCSIDVDRVAQAAIDVLPDPALSALAEVFSLLEISPWSGRPI